jgi:hypothetical protein
MVKVCLQDVSAFSSYSRDRNEMISETARTLLTRRSCTVFPRQSVMPLHARSTKEKTNFFSVKKNPVFTTRINCTSLYTNVLYVVIQNLIKSHVSLLLFSICQSHISILPWVLWNTTLAAERLWIMSDDRTVLYCFYYYYKLVYFDPQTTCGHENKILFWINCNRKNNQTSRISHIIRL